MNNSKNDWNDDVLNRKQYADFLTEYLISKKKSFVININSPWGSGKTFFLESWAKDLNHDHPCAFFNAWKNDFSNDPLLAVVSCIHESLSPLLNNLDDGKEIANKILSSSGRILKAISPIIVKGALSKAIGQDGADGLFNLSNDNEKLITDTLSKATEVLIKNNKKIEKSVSDFQDSIFTMIEKVTDNGGLEKPLFIFIDELDRCRPLYAIELLERVKHLFGNEGVVFIIATDTDQLKHSVNAIYGSGFDSNIYLRRFFDQVYTLPDPDYVQFSKLLFDNFKSNVTFFSYDIRFTGELSQTEEISSDYIKKNEFTFIVKNTSNHENILFFSLFSEFFKLDLRTQKQCFERFLAILSIINFDKEFVHFPYLIFLIMLEAKDKYLFESFFLLSNDVGSQRIKEIKNKFSSEYTVRVNRLLYKAINFLEFFSDVVFFERMDLMKHINEIESDWDNMNIFNPWRASILKNLDGIKKYKNRVELACDLE